MMLRRLRCVHPVGYCFLAEILFLGVLLGAPLLLLLGFSALGVDVARLDDYFFGTIQEGLGALTALVLLARTGKLELLRRRGSGFWDGLLVGMYPLGMTCYTVIVKCLLGMPDGPLRRPLQIFWYFAAMAMIGVAEELLFRGVIAQTLLEHFGTDRSGIWKACILSGLFFGGAHLTNLMASTPLGVLMQCIFAASLGVLYAAIYFRTGNLWVLVFLHGANDAAALLAGGLYGTETMAETVSSYDPTMLFSVLLYVLPALWLLRRRKRGEVALYFGRDAV